jgi:hypothetical protein
LGQIAFQTWATRCALTGKANSGEGGGTVVGGGTDMTATNGKLDGIKGSVDALKDGDGNGNGLSTAPAMPWSSGSGSGSSWSSGLSDGGSCPAPIETSITLGAYSQAVAFSFGPLCDFAALLNLVVKTAGLVLAAYIVAGLRR